MFPTVAHSSVARCRPSVAAVRPLPALREHPPGFAKEAALSHRPMASSPTPLRACPTYAGQQTRWLLAITWRELTTLGWHPYLAISQAVHTTSHLFVTQCRLGGGGVGCTFRLSRTGSFTHSHQQGDFPEHPSAGSVLVTSKQGPRIGASWLVSTSDWSSRVRARFSRYSILCDFIIRFDSIRFYYIIFDSILHIRFYVFDWRC